MSGKCQSCGMPLARDPQGGGTEADGSRSTTYCSLCFEVGAFKQPDITASEMQDFCVKVLSEKGMPRIMAWMFTRGIPKLDRWQN